MWVRSNSAFSAAANSSFEMVPRSPLRPVDCFAVDTQPHRALDILIGSPEWAATEHFTSNYGNRDERR